MSDNASSTESLALISSFFSLFNSNFIHMSVHEKLHEQICTNGS